MAEVATAAAAAVASAISYIGTAAGAVAAGTATAAQIVTTIAVNVVTSLAMSAVSSALMAPDVGAGGSPIAFKADPAAPISGVMGRFGVGGRQVHANTWGKDNLYMSFVVALSLGPIQSYEEFTANTVAVTFPGAQGLAASVEPYKDKMWQTRRLGLPTDAYLTIPTGVPDGTPSGGGTPFAEWTSAHTLPGIAHALWTLKNNSKRASYESGVPAPVWTLHGMKLWDPRADSTYPGGSGTQRRGDWTTWAYTDNPYLHALAFARGHFKLNADGSLDTTKRIAGIGAADDAVDIGAFVEGANVCDANGWTIAGEWTTVDDKWQVLAAMLQAGGGSPLNRGAKISCMVEAPRASVLTLTGEDIVGPVNLSVMASRRDRPNTIIPRARLEAQRFEEVALGAVSSATYVTEDGGETRTREVPYRYVGAAKQAAELAAYGLANAREPLKGSFPCKPHLLGLRAGDAFAVTSAEHGLSAQKFVVLKRAFDPASAVVTLEVRSETDAKHAWALGRVADPPTPPTLDPADPTPATPLTADWTVVPRPVEASGVQQPGLIVTGAAVGDNIGSVQIEVGSSAIGPWEQVYSGPPTTAEVAINGLIGGDDYYVAITYWSLRGVPSAQLVKGPYTAPGLTAGDVTPIVPSTVAGTPTLSISTAIMADGTQVSRLNGTWAAPTNALTYIVELDNGTVTTSFPATAAAIVDRIVPTGPTYRYRVKAVSRTGTPSAAWSSWSASVAAGGDVTAPPAIVSGTVTAIGGRRIAVTLKIPPVADYLRAALYRNTTGFSPDDIPQDPVAYVAGDSYVDVNLTVGLLYRYYARPLDRSGNEGATTFLGSATPVHVSVAGGDVDAGDVTLVTSLGTSNNTSNVGTRPAVDLATLANGDGVALPLYVSGSDTADLVGGKYTRLTGVSTFNQMVISREAINGPAQVSGRLTTTLVGFGFTQLAALVTDSRTSCAAHFYRTGSTWTVMSGTTTLQSLGSAYNGVTFSADTLFAITDDGITQRWWADGVEMYSRATPAGSTFRRAAAYAFGTNGSVGALALAPYNNAQWSAVSGTGRPDDNASRADNYLLNATFERGFENYKQSSAVFSLNGRWVRYTGTSGSPALYFNTKEADSATTLNDMWVRLPEGGRLYLGYDRRTDGARTTRFQIQWFSEAGAIGTADVVGSDASNTAGAIQRVKTTATAPAGYPIARVAYQPLGSANGTYTEATNFRAGPTEERADITADNVSSGYTGQTLWGTYSAHLPANIAPRVATALDASGVLQTAIPSALADSSNILRRTAGGLYTGDLAATAGATWGTNVSSRPAELTDGRITTALNASGVLQTAIPSALADTSNILRRTGGGLFTGALAATAGATWGVDVASRPTELTDGRVATALTALGVLQTNIPSALADSSNILRKTGGGLFTGSLAATAGATWGTDVSSRPVELTDGRITTALNASGVLQTAIPSTLADTSNILRKTGGGLFTGDLAATAGAAWATNLTGRPTELTDGRIATALNSSGVLQTAITTTVANSSNLLRYTGGGLAGGLALLSSVTASEISANAVTTTKVLAGSINPPYSALTTSSVLWTAESAEKDVQSLVVTVVRGSVKIDALINVLFDSVASSATTGILRLYRGATELTSARISLGATISQGSNFIFPPQWVLSYLDAPGAGTYTYKITFQPGSTNNGQVGQRTLTCLPQEG